VPEKMQHKANQNIKKYIYIRKAEASFPENASYVIYTVHRENLFLFHS
jgi:hypothetical protein